MKILSCLFLGLLTTSLAAEYREWTDAKSGKTITAKPLQKSMGKDRIELKLESGKVVWIQINRLAEDDQKFANHWAPRKDLITTKVIRFGSKYGRGWKDIKVTALGGTTGGSVVMYAYSNQRRPKIKKLKPGETGTFEFRGTETWEVEFTHDESILDSENHKTKTGKTER